MIKVGDKYRCIKKEFPIKFTYNKIYKVLAIDLVNRNKLTAPSIILDDNTGYGVCILLSFLNINFIKVDYLKLKIRKLKKLVKK